jgi:hypothetical protein
MSSRRENTVNELSTQGLRRSKTKGWDNTGETAFLTVHKEHFFISMNTIKLIWKSPETRFQDYLWKISN